MAERGNTTHGPNLDDKMKQETQGLIKGNKPTRVEEGRETEPFADETDSEEVQEAAEPNTAQEPAAGDEGGDRQ